MNAAKMPNATIRAWSTRTLLLFIAGVITMGSVHAQGIHTDANADPIQWGACPPSPDGLPDAGQQCSVLSLPLDYRAPAGQTINIAISRIKAANPSLRRGVLLLNPGGPGGSGIDLPREFTILLPQAVLDRYDLIGFDPRGVGRSTPLTCGLTPAEAIEAYSPLEQPGGFSATAAFAHNVADDCTAGTGAVLPFITTANTARDMDQIRQALGEVKISYLGYSYGTYLGAVYSSLFASHTDRVVLDSSVDPSWLWRQQFREWGPGGELRFPDFANFAAANDETYHLGQTSAQIYDVYLQLLNSLYKSPITFPDGTVFNAPMFRELLFAVLYDDRDFPALAPLWQVLKDSPGDTAAVQHALQIVNPTSPPVPGVPSDNMAASGLAVLCGDIAWSHSVDQYQAEFNVDSLLFPLFGALGSNIWSCAFWPNPPIEPPVTITSDGPGNILMVQDIRDPAAPYWGALGMHAALGQRSRIVSVDQGGHGVYVFKTNVCANDITTVFLVDGVFPNNDVFCPAESGSGAAGVLDSQTKEQVIRELLRQMKFK